MSIDPNTVVLPDPESLDEDIAIVELGHMFLEMWRREAAFIKKYGHYRQQHIEARLNGINHAISVIVDLIIQTGATTFDGLLVKFLALNHARGCANDLATISADNTPDFNVLASILTDIKDGSWAHLSPHVAQAA